MAIFASSAYFHSLIRGSFDHLAKEGDHRTGEKREEKLVSVRGMFSIQHTTNILDAYSIPYRRNIIDQCTLLTTFLGKV
jgi:hypothetical protein